MDTKLLSAYIEQYHHSDPDVREKIICKCHRCCENTPTNSVLDREDKLTRNFQ